MPATAVSVFVGLACGALVAGAGLALWYCYRQAPGIPRAVHVIRWVAGALLIVGALEWWRGGHNPSAPVLQLILMATLVAPPGVNGRSLASRSHVLLILPALVLAGTGLFWISAPVETDTVNGPIAPVGLAVTVCGGLGARAVGLVLSKVATSGPHVEWPSTAAFALLTLIAGSAALVNVWQRGTVWVGTGSESGLAGAWLAWAAAWAGRRQPPWLRAGLTIVAAVSLILVAAGYPILQNVG